ncbi:MAG TPA: beta-ketoacyl-ACP synthase II [Phycisphaerae bacterium]|nr:beta-ketoacyl-ACP synthase II [Phycisphaerae bacterium]HNU44582.1 beta-ketoacyl-ACP synthase II [Phycisphaerae bacterium]
MTERRVVVTGMGAVTPLGCCVDAFWDALVSGRSGVATITRFDPTGFPVRIAGECRTFDPSATIDSKTLKRLDRFVQFALVSCREAVASSGFSADREDPYRVAAVFGTGIGGLNEIEEQHSRLLERGPTKVSPFTIPRLMVNAASGNISIELGLKGESIAVSSACASATNAMGIARDLIRVGKADVVFTGGSEATVTPLAMAAFASMKAVSTRNDQPSAASRPFDRDRDGFVLAEGAATFVFEELEHARRRAAPVLAEVAGFGSTSDAQHITQPDENGEGAATAMRQALADARVTAQDVDYINAHGTATPLGDIAETKAIKQVFGEHAHRLVISSTKSAVGHLLGASGAVELVATIRTLQTATVTPTLNLDHPDEGCDLDYCPHTARDRRVRVALSNSFGFGGHNACIIVRRWE